MSSCFRVIGKSINISEHFFLQNDMSDLTKKIYVINTCNVFYRKHTDVQLCISSKKKITNGEE